MSETLNYERVSYTVKETAQEMRKALRKAFPGVKFSVTMSRGTGHGWLHVNWTDGPLDRDVRPICDGFRDSYFDGMDDSYHNIESTLYMREDGSLFEPKFSCRGVNMSRSFSPEAEAWAEFIAVRGSYWWPDGLDLWQDTLYYAVRKLLSGMDLTNGFPTNPREAFREHWS